MSQLVAADWGALLIVWGFGWRQKGAENAGRGQEVKHRYTHMHTHTHTSAKHIDT